MTRRQPHVVRLAAKEPFASGALVEFLALRAVPGIEEVVDGGLYRRTMRLPGGGGVLELSFPAGAVLARFWLDDPADLDVAVARTRFLADLDADPSAIDTVLGTDEALAPLVERVPGRRVPHTVDGVELAMRAVLGQQVSVKAARTLAGRLVARLGEPLAAPIGGLTHRFPTATAIAGADLAGLGLTGARAATLRALASALAGGSLVLAPGSDPRAIETALTALPGVGPWTAAYISMRALGDPDAFVPTDLGVRRALERLGLPLSTSERWRPFRAYALMHLWG